MKINIDPFSYDVYKAKEGTNIYNNKVARELGFKVDISEIYFNLSKEEVLDKLIEDLQELIRKLKIYKNDDSRDMSCIELKREILDRKSRKK